MHRCTPSDPGQARAPASPPALPAPALRQRRVLCVDDDAVNRLLLQALLQHRSDLVLDLAGDGASGLAAARRSPPDLLLLDMRLPDMGGLQLLHALRADPRLAGVPGVAVSGNAMPEDVAAALRGGFDGYVTKPIAGARLLAEIDRWLDPAPV